MTKLLTAPDKLQMPPVRYWAQDNHTPRPM